MDALLSAINHIGDDGVLSVTIVGSFDEIKLQVCFEQT